MHFIYDILFSPSYPFVTAPSELPGGLIADLHFLGASEVVLTDVEIKKTSWAVQFLATLDGGEETWMMRATNVQKGYAYVITDEEGYTRGRLITGNGVFIPVSLHGLDIAVDPSVVLPPVTYSPLETEDSYSFEGADGITLTLNQETNEVTFGVDESEFTKTTLLTEESSLMSSVDVGIATLGGITGETVGLSIEGMTAKIFDEDVALRIVWESTESDIWPGCDGIDVIGEALHCSVDDGSSYIYPLDTLLCEEESDTCPYTWETEET